MSVSQQEGTFPKFSSYLKVVNNCSARTTLIAVSLYPNGTKLVSMSAGELDKLAAGTFSAAWTFPNAAPVQKLSITAGNEECIRLDGGQGYVTVAVPAKPGYWIVRDSVLVKSGEVLTISDFHLKSFVTKVPVW